jgi:hypothetical protein
LTNYLIDLEAGIILDVEASAVNKAAEAEATRTMIDRVEQIFDLKPERLVGDTNYGSLQQTVFTDQVFGFLIA